MPELDRVAFGVGGLGEAAVRVGLGATPDQLGALWVANEGLLATATNPLPGITASFPTIVDNRYFPVGGGEADSAPDCAALRPNTFDSAPYIGAFEPGGGTPENWLVTTGGWISFASN